MLKHYLANFILLQYTLLLLSFGSISEVANLMIALMFYNPQENKNWGRFFLKYWSVAERRRLELIKTIKMQLINLKSYPTMGSFTNITIKFISDQISCFNTEFYEKKINKRLYRNSGGVIYKLENC